MGKTYRYDSDCGEKTGKTKKRTFRKRWCDYDELEKFAVPAKDGCMPFDCAVDDLYKHIEHKIDLLEESGVVRPSEREYFHDFIVNHLKPKYMGYDPAHLNANGEFCSLRHYLKISTESIVTNIVASRARPGKNATLVPISYENSEKAKEDGAVSAEDLSDGCRSVKELEFKMDVQTLRSMLSREERKVLDMRIEGYSNEEIGSSFQRDRHWVEKTVLPKIQDAARRCGFVPQSEVRIMERGKKAA